MILRNSLYTIESAETSGAEARYGIRLNAGHFIYKAHFPGEPVTPGVCIVQMAMELLGETVGRRLRVVKVKNVKFLSVVTPTRSTAVTFQFMKITEDEGVVKAQVVVTSEGEAKAKLSFTCAYPQK